MLTVLSDWTEEGRRGKIDERGQSSGERQWWPAMAGLIPAGERRNRAREVVVEVRGEGDQGFGGSGCGESRRAARFGRHERQRRRCSGSARHELENEGEGGGENEVGQWNVVEGLSGGADVGAVMRGVAGGTVAGMGAGVGDTEQNQNFRFPNPEPPGFRAKQIQFWSAQN